MSEFEHDIKINKIFGILMNRRLKTMILDCSYQPLFMVLNYHKLYIINVFTGHLVCKYIQAGTTITV